MTFARLDTEPFVALDAALSGRAAGIAVATSGSTGAPRLVNIESGAIRTSAASTATALGGDAAWLLAIPAERIGGAMVVARSTLAGTPLARLEPGSFTPDAFARATDTLAREGRRHVSLVPTQLRRLLAEPTGRDALAAYDRVLVGGAALLDADLPANVVATYGMSETCGGCVYDGVPLEGVRVRLADDGRIRIAGPTLAAGYADGVDDAFSRDDAGVTWFTTSDLGEWRDGRLAVLGRADHVINTGGVKVHPQAVEEVLATIPGVRAAVVGVPDPEWGERVVAVVAGDPAQAALARALEALPRTHRPRRIVAVTDLPLTAGGKIDRAAARALATKETA